METIYKIEIGTLIDEKQADYNLYNKVYDKKHGFCDEGDFFNKDLENAVRLAKEYVENNVNNTYAIVSKLEYDKKDIGIIDNDIEFYLKWGIDYIDYFGNELCDIKNVVYNVCKMENNIQENFMKEVD